MFSESWLLLILALFILGAVLGHSGLLLIAVLMTAASSLAWLWNAVVLYRVEYARELTASRTFAGEPVSLDVSVTNRKALPVPWLRIDDVFPNTVTLRASRPSGLVEHKLEPSSAPGRAILRHLTSLGPYERVRWTYQIDCAQRGFYFFGNAEAQAGDVFGFFVRRQGLTVPDRLIVYPRVRPLPELGFPSKEPFGDKRIMQHIVEDPIRTAGVREYHPEDSIKRVHWKVSARQGELQVKVFEPSITQQLVVFLNISSFAQTWQGIIPERQEQAISVAASIAYHAIERRFAVGLIANGSVPYSDQPIKVLPSRDPDQLMRVLEALAAVTSFATSDITKLLVAVSPRLALGATLVVVTTIVTENLEAEMLRLRDAGRRLALVSLDPAFHGAGPSGITTYHIPLAEADFAGVWTRASADEQTLAREGLTRDRDRFLRFRRGG